MTFDPFIVGNPALLNGSIAALVVKTAEPLAPQTIVDVDDTWEVDVTWEIDGFVAPALGGDWTVKLFLESKDGLNATHQIASVNVPLSSVAPSTHRVYHANIKIASHVVNPGLCQLTAAITYSNLGVRLDMAGFQDGPLMQFLDPGPIETD